MPEIKRDWDLLTDGERRKVTDEIIGFFQKERGEEIGVIAAGELLDCVLKASAGSMYNRVLDDLRPFLEQKFSDTLFDIETFLRK